MKDKFVMVASYPDSIIRFRGELLEEIKKVYEMDVHIVAPFKKHNNALVRDLESKGYHVHSVFMQRTGKNPFFDLITILNLFFILLRIKPKYVFLYTIKPVIYGMLASKFAGIKNRVALITGLGYAFSDNNGRFSRSQLMAQTLYRLSLKFSTYIFFQNPDDKNLFESLNIINEKYATSIVNGSGVNLMDYAYTPISDAEQRVNFLMIARIIVDKGVREYVDAARAIKKDFPDSRFSLVGWIDDNPNGIRKEELQSWIDEGVIDYLGKLSDVRSVIAENQIYVLPSYREGTPRTVLEAMAIGRAIITTNAPGCKETVIDGENGFLVPVQDSAALANAMLKFCHDPSLSISMGYKSRSLVEEKYDVNKVNTFILENMGIR